jgi:acyl carrier protein
VPGGGIIPLKTHAMADRVLAPKILGTAILDEVLASEPLDFVVLCSSFNAMLGGVGQIDYTAANAYLDAFAHANTREGGPVTISINWAVWQEVGMAFDTQVPEQYRQIKEETLRNGLRTAEGQEAFLRVLNNPLPQIIVSPQDLTALLQSTKSATAVTPGPDAATPGTPAPNASAQPAEARSARHARPPLQTTYAAPRNDIEEQLAFVWQQLFGIDTIGIHDNFFELGGHSLLATQVLVRLQERFGVDLPVRTIFESHTIAELASHLEMILWAAENQRVPVAFDDADREEVEF